jgi:hypothetical protein
MKAQIVGIGACVADTLWCLPTYPTEDTKMKAEESRQAGGGPVATPQSWAQIPHSSGILPMMQAGGFCIRILKNTA